MTQSSKIPCALILSQFHRKHFSVSARLS